MALPTALLCLTLEGTHSLPLPPTHQSQCRHRTQSSGPLFARGEDTATLTPPPAAGSASPPRFHTRASGAAWQKQELLDHDLLSREEEVRYGRQVVRARELRERIDALLGTPGREDGAPRRAAGDDGGDGDVPSPELALFAADAPPPRRDGPSRRRSGQPTPYTSLRRVPLDRLTDADAVALGAPGGKAELVEVLRAGARARDVLMRRNAKLAMSIAKRWALSRYEGDPGRAFEGSWDRPSLDEALQEGALGLARAVDGYDPERGLRFSTYATHWIQSHVRTCFQRAATGCLRVPGQLHDLRAKHARIVRDHVVAGTAPPEKEAIARELGVSKRRLETALRSTRTLLSVDAPLAGRMHKGSGAGGDGPQQELVILDTLQWCVGAGVVPRFPARPVAASPPHLFPRLRPLCSTQPPPEDQVELSLLRQVLENAMATELTPYERDILRLRVGLDRGAGMTVRQIAALSGGTVSLADVRGAERRAFRKLRHPGSVHARHLRAHAGPMADAADARG